MPRDYSAHDLFTMDALSSYHLKNYTRAVLSFEKISLKEEDKLIYTKALTLNGNKAKAKDFINKNYQNTAFKTAASKDPVLKPIVAEIEQDIKRAKDSETEKEKEKARLRELEIKKAGEIELKKEAEKKAAESGKAAPQESQTVPSADDTKPDDGSKNTIPSPEQ
jgi:hypothetical protein